MSQLRVEAGVDVAKAYVAVVDLEARSVEVTLLLVVAAGVEGAADTAVRLARDGEDGPALLDRLLEGLGPAGLGLFEEELRGALVGPGPGVVSGAPPVDGAAGLKGAPPPSGGPGTAGGAGAGGGGDGGASVVSPPS